MFRTFGSSQGLTAALLTDPEYIHLCTVVACAAAGGMSAAFRRRHHVLRPFRAALHMAYRPVVARGCRRWTVPVVGQVFRGAGRRRLFGGRLAVDAMVRRRTMDRPPVSSR